LKNSPAPREIILKHDLPTYAGPAVPVAGDRAGKCGSPLRPMRHEAMKKEENA
jgi:hypothetical protein